MKKVFLIICLVLLCSLNFAQDKKSKSQKGVDIVVKPKKYKELVDSLKAELAVAKEDTNKVNLLSSLSFQYYSINPDKGIEYGEQGLKIAEKINWIKGQAKCYVSLGVVYSAGKSDYPKALEYYSKALKMNEELGNKNEIAFILGNMGNIYAKQSDYPKALEFHLTALKMNEELGNTSGIARVLGNMGNVYQNQSDYPKALEYYSKALKMNEELGNTSGIAANLTNMGLINWDQSDYPKALEYYSKALKINEELGNKVGITANLTNMGNIYAKQSDYSKALEYYLKALKINEELGNKSEIANNLANLGNVYRSQSDYPKALEYCSKALKINEELGTKRGIATILGNMGIVYRFQADYPKALEYYLKALKINEELGNKRGIATILGSLGVVYSSGKSDYPKALEYFIKALKMNEELGNKNAIAINLANLGIVYQNQSDYPKALEYHSKALKMNEELGNKSAIANNLTNIGSLYSENGEFDKALENMKNGLKLLIEIQEHRGTAYTLNMLSENFNKQAQMFDSLRTIGESKDSLIVIKIEKNYESALQFGKDAEKLADSIGLTELQPTIFENLYEVYKKLKNPAKALEYHEKYTVQKDSIFSMEKSKEIANLDAKRENELKDKEIEIQTKENEILKQQSYNQTLELDRRNKEVSLLSANQKVQKLELDKRNSELNILQKDKELADLSIKAKEAESQNKEKEILLLQANEQSQKIKIKQATNQRYVLIGGLLLFALFIIFIFARFREKKRLSEKLAIQNAEIENQKRIVESQKEIVEEQKEILLEKNEQIYSSINYAATIQQAILPWESTLKQAFSDILVFYKPKDIVSGDAYWFQEIEGIRFLAVIDCTGHGIPGAMLTVIASDVLDDAVLSKRLTDTGKILTYMNQKVTEVLNQRLLENQMKDGMELALVAISDTSVQFSGAGRPLYTKNGTFETLKTDRRGIAGQSEDNDYKFNTIEIKKSENFILYLTTDGFPDQMNEHSKKYSTKRFVTLLESISDKPMEEQNQILEYEFNSHKGNRNQIDDITIVGVRV